MPIEKTAATGQTTRPRGSYRWRYQGKSVGILSDNCLDITESASGDTRQYLSDIGLTELGQTVCFQCGTCSAVCPHDQDLENGDKLNIRQLIQETQFSPTRSIGDRRWLCATCNACVSQCPRDVDITAQMSGLRRFALESGTDSVPHSAKLAMTSLASLGNPFAEPRERRRDWTNGHQFKSPDSEVELLFFPGCFPAYDTRAGKIALAISQILRRVGVNFAVLGSRESCCGESVRRLGNESLFRQLAEQNIAAFREAGVSRVLVTSPHCYHTFKDEYPEFGADFEVVHYTTYLWDLIRQGRLKLRHNHSLRVTYHDPCYLGRHHDIYREPRQILESIPGLELVEMADHSQRSLCCGGGGGRIWTDLNTEQNMPARRLAQAVATGADVLLTACPYCLTNFDSINESDGDGSGIQVSDIAELVLAALETDE